MSHCVPEVQLAKPYHVDQHFVADIGEVGFWHSVAYASGAPKKLIVWLVRVKAFPCGQPCAYPAFFTLALSRDS